MQTSKPIIYRFLNLLLGDSISLNSSVLRLFEKFNSEKILLFVLVMAIFSSWYEGIIVSVIGITYLPQLFILILFFVSLSSKTIFRKFDIWYLLFLLTCSFSAFLAALRGLHAGLFLPGIFIFLQFYIVFIAVRGLRNKKMILKSLLLGSLPLAFLGIYQFAVRLKTPSLWVSGAESIIQTRAYGLFGSPNVLGMVLVFAAIISFSLYIYEKKYFYLPFFFLSCLALVFTFSRSAWFAFVVAFFVAGVVYRKRIVYLLPLVGAVGLFSRQISERVLTIFSPNYLHDAYLDGRVWSAINGLHIFSKHAFWGTGPGTYGGQIAVGLSSPVYLEGIQKGYTALYYTDNQFLEVLVQTGVVGFLLFALFLLSLFISIIKKDPKDNIIKITALMTIVALAVAGLFENVLEFGAIAYPAGIILGVVVDNEKKHSDTLQWG